MLIFFFFGVLTAQAHLYINIFLFSFFFKFYFYTLQNCTSFAKYQNESTTGIHELQNPPPSSLPIPSLWVVPVH